MFPHDLIVIIFANIIFNNAHGSTGSFIQATESLDYNFQVCSYVFQAFVGVVRRNVAVMEELVVKAEAEVGSVSSVKKMLQLFKLPLFGTPVSATVQ